MNDKKNMEIVNGNRDQPWKIRIYGYRFLVIYFILTLPVVICQYYNWRQLMGNDFHDSLWDVDTMIRFFVPMHIPASELYEGKPQFEVMSIWENKYKGPPLKINPTALVSR